MAVDFPKLPDFERPPVVEVVLSLQFEPISKLQVQHIGFLWSHFQNRFPKVETKPPLDPVFEFLEPKPARPTLRFEVSEFPPFPRVWFMKESGGELLQIQSDRFIHNWRKSGDASVYPRYEHIREQFRQELQLFMEFLADNQLGEVRPNQCEITYINHLESGRGWKTHGEAPLVLRSLTSDFEVPFLPQPEAVRFSTRYLLSHEADGKPCGRLYVDLNPALSAETQDPIFILNLTARAVPAKPDIAAAMDFYDQGRRYIVCTFDAITTDAMHEIWGKQNANKSSV